MDYTRWVTVNKDIIDIKTMTTAHIKNTMQMISKGSQKNGFVINADWLKTHGKAYLIAFENELEERAKLYDARIMMGK